jgi:hypothetical protein
MLLKLHNPYRNSMILKPVFACKGTMFIALVKVDISLVETLVDSFQEVLGRKRCVHNML